MVEIKTGRKSWYIFGVNGCHIELHMAESAEICHNSTRQREELENLWADVPRNDLRSQWKCL